jgi:hypothetical protein
LEMKKALSIGLVLMGVCALNAASRSIKGVVFENFLEPAVNGSVYLDLNGYASIDIAILIDDQGCVNDWLTLRTNDKLLIASVANVIDMWNFEAPTLAGEPSWSYIELNISFQGSGRVVTINPTMAVQSLFNLVRDDFYMVVPFSELDMIPEPIIMDAPVLHSSLLENNSGKTVRFQFFIDAEGNVRMPIVKESETENVVTAVILESLLKWKFAPPTRYGEHVGTIAMIPFNIP